MLKNNLFFINIHAILHCNSLGWLLFLWFSFQTLFLCLDGNYTWKSLCNLNVKESEEEWWARDVSPFIPHSSPISEPVALPSLLEIILVWSADISKVLWWFLGSSAISNDNASLKHVLEIRNLRTHQTYRIRTYTESRSLVNALQSLKSTALMDIIFLPYFMIFDPTLHFVDNQCHSLAYIYT